jgi:hypothetical protein
MSRRLDLPRPPAPVLAAPRGGAAGPISPLFINEFVSGPTPCRHLLPFGNRQQSGTTAREE